MYSAFVVLFILIPLRLQFLPKKLSYMFQILEDVSNVCCTLYDSFINCTFFIETAQQARSTNIYTLKQPEQRPNGDRVVLRRVLRLPWYGVSEQNSRLFIKDRIRSHLKGATENIITPDLSRFLYVHGDTCKCKGLALKKSVETRFSIPR